MCLPYLISKLERMRSIDRQGKITVEYDLDGTLGFQSVDAHQLRQVFGNIL